MQRLRFSLVVENYGIGIPNSERGLVFQPGYRGQRARDEVPVGAGIGLSEAQKIMTWHGGHVRLESRLLHGDESSGAYLTQVELVFPYRFSGREEFR